MTVRPAAANHPTQSVRCDETTMVHGDAAALPIPDRAVPCIVTSPPYNVGVDYSGVNDRHSDAAYATLVAAWCSEMHRALEPGGRCWVVVPTAGKVNGDGRRVNMPLLWMQALTDAGLRYRDTIAWIKPVSTSTTAWGSYLSPSAPNLRGGWEPILLFYRDQWRRNRSGEKLTGHADEWARLCRNRWDIPPVTANTGHPAPFPSELARRAILLSTWPGEVVLDPFAGSGTTLRAAEHVGRIGVGVEASPLYVARWQEGGVQSPLTETRHKETT